MKLYLATLCTSVMVARVQGRRGRSDMVTLPSGPSTLTIVQLVLIEERYETRCKIRKISFRKIHMRIRRAIHFNQIVIKVANMIYARVTLSDYTGT